MTFERKVPQTREAASFQGTIRRLATNSQPSWSNRTSEETKHRPSIIVIVLDDVGYGQLGCYGSRIETSNIDALANNGLRYTNFHVTAQCSPTRACLLTGRNNHTVGMGYLADFDTGFPSYRGQLSASAATLPEILRDAGYSTYGVGKWHVMPPSHMTLAGPFHQWPTGRGFDRFYGFLGGEENHWNPVLFEDQHLVTPSRYRDDYHLSEDLVDKSIEYIDSHFMAAPERPFFLYVAFGAGHAPHHAPSDYIDAYRGIFDEGWDRARANQLRRQISLGVVPPDTCLSPRNPDVQAWESLSREQQRLYARMQEVYAGFLHHADVQVGRLTDLLSRRGSLGETLLVVMSDNGASAEGGKHGSINEYRYFLGLPDTLEDNLAGIRDLGGPRSHNHYPAGWAQAGNTPLKFYKKHTYAGGVRAPLIIHWPSRLHDQGGLRGQFHHVIDIAPTILELANVAPPRTHRGMEQIPIHGVSMTSSFRNTETPSTRETQYFELAGQRGIVHGEWKLVTLHQSGRPYHTDQWELYNIKADYSECVDRADEYPEKVRELERLWWTEAKKYGVFPLDDRTQDRLFAVDNESARRSFRLYQGGRLLGSVAGPNLAYRPFVVTAYVDEFGPETEGVILAHGHRAAGFVLFVACNRLYFDYNLAGNHEILASDAALGQGTTKLQAKLVRVGGAAQVELSQDDSVIRKVQVSQLFPGGFGWFTTQCGFNSPSPVSDLYDIPYSFTGHIDHVDIALDDQDTRAASAAWLGAHMHE